MAKDSQGWRGQVEGQIILIQVPKWAASAYVALSAAVVLVASVLVVGMVFLAFVAGSVASNTHAILEHLQELTATRATQDEIRRTVNKTSTRIERLYTNDRIRREFEEHERSEDHEGQEPATDGPD